MVALGAATGGGLAQRLADPSNRVGEALVQMLAKRFSLAVVNEPPAATDLTLRVSTVEWVVTCRVLSKQCQTNYHAALSLTDRRSGAVLATGDCSKGYGDRVVRSELPRRGPLSPTGRPRGAATASTRPRS